MCQYYNEIRVIILSFMLSLLILHNKLIVTNILNISEKKNIDTVATNFNVS